MGICIINKLISLGCFNSTPCVEPEILVSNNWKNLNLDNFQLKFGETIQVKDSNIKGIVLDYLEENNEKWYGVCFTNENKIFGRTVYSGCSKECIDMLDFTYFHESLFDSVIVKEKLLLDVNKIRKGGSGAVMTKAEIENSFNLYLLLREKTPTPCNKKNWNLKAINDCYFEISSILKTNN